MWRLFQVLLVLTLMLSGINAETKNSMQSKKSMSLEEINKKDSLRRIDKAFNDLEEHSKQKYFDCLKTFGDPKFCQCFQEQIPLGVDFPGYVKIVTTSKADLGYDQADSDTKKLIDLAITTRETCVSQSNITAP